MQGVGLYHSATYTGSVPNFSLVGGRGAPLWAVKGKCSFDGVYYTSNSFNKAGGWINVSRLQSDVWTDLTATYTAVQSSLSIDGIVPDPFTAGLVYMMQGVAFNGQCHCLVELWYDCFRRQDPDEGAGCGRATDVDVEC